MATGGMYVATPMAKQNTLIVNNLPDYFTEEELRSMFTTFGTVKATRISKNPKTDKSQGYGFVEYTSRKEAEKAIEQVDGLQLGKTKIRVAFSEPIDDKIKQATKVIVKKIPFRVDEDELHGMFAKFGKIVKTRLLRDSVTNKSRRMGFLFFEKWADAQKAVTEMDGFQPENSKDKLKLEMEQSSVKPATWPQWQRASDQQVSAPPARPRGPQPYPQTRPQSQGQAAIQARISTGPSPNCVFVYNIGEYISEQELYNLFSQFGGLKKIDIVRDANTHLCKGYAFLNFESYQAAESAIFTMDGMFYRGRQLQVRFKYS